MRQIKDLTLKTTRRVAMASILAALGTGILCLSPVSGIAAPAKLEVPKPSAEDVAQIQAGLKGSLGKASLEEIERALRAAVAAHPDAAPAYVAVILDSGRQWTCPDVARITAVAIEALGKNPRAEVIFAIVRTSIILDEECAPVIVKAAIKAAPRALAYRIVEVAVASLRHPGEFVRDGKQLSRVTQSEALANAALEAFPELDPALVFAAANRGLSGSLAGLGLPNLPGEDGPIFNSTGGGSQINNPNPNTNPDSQ